MSTNVFLAGIPLEDGCPQAHQAVLSAARFLASAQHYGTASYPESRDMVYANEYARKAADILHATYRTGARTVWLAVVRYAVELHVARLSAERVDS